MPSGDKLPKHGIPYLRIPERLMNTDPVDTTSIHPVAADPNPNAVDIEIKELKQQLHTQRKEYKVNLNASTDEITTLKAKVQELEDHLESLRAKKESKPTKVRERKGLFAREEGLFY